MIVVTIILMLTIVAAPVLSPAREEKRLREAARAVHAYFGSARALALETGRPVGVMLERQQMVDSQSGRSVAVASRACLTLSQVEPPSPYTGDVSGATVMVQQVIDRDPQGSPLLPLDSNGNPAYFNIAFKPTDADSMQMDSSGTSMQMAFQLQLLRVGDWVQFNNQGPRFRLTGQSPNTNGFITGFPIYATTYNTGQIVSNLPWPTPPPSTGILNPLVNNNTNQQWSSPVSYVIYRQPVRSTASPLALPPPVAIDLQFSGNDSYYADSPMGDPITFAPPTNWPNITLPIYIMFAPNGTVQEVYATAPYSPQLQLARYHPTEPLYLLIGDQGRIKTNADTTSLPSSPAADEFPNWYYKNSLWLMLAPQSGLMRIAENYPVDVTDSQIVGKNFSWNADPSIWTTAWGPAIWQSRAFARSAEDVGGTH